MKNNSFSDKASEALQAEINSSHPQLSKIKQLIAEGANVNFKGRGGYTAILIAVEKGYLEIVEFLMVNGSDLSLKCDDGRGIFSLVSNDIIYKTLDYGKPFSQEQKKKLWDYKAEEKEYEECLETSKLKRIDELKKHLFP